MRIQRIHGSPEDPATTCYSSNCSELPEVSLADDLNMMILLEDVLLVKGNVKSEAFGREQSFNALQRNVYIHQLMHLHGTRKARLIHYRKQMFPEEIHKETDFVDLLKQRRKKVVITREKEYIKNREHRFMEDLMSMVRHISTPKLLYVGKAVLYRHCSAADINMPVRRVVAYKFDEIVQHGNNFLNEHSLIGNISDRAKDLLLKKQWSRAKVFNVKEEFIIEHRQQGDKMEWDHIKTEKKRLLVEIEGVYY